MSLHIPFDNSYARLSGAFFTAQAPTPVSAPRLVAFNEPLARIMSIAPGEVGEMAQVFAGNRVPDGAAPLAQAYAGHQFGTFNPQLGDGRAVLLGETVGTDGIRRDLQLKGSGPTPYSRMGDGRAWLGPVLREYVVSEAMHALGIPTTRALAAVETGDKVVRETVLPGAVLARVATSHLRVGTFQIFAARDDTASLKQLTQYAIDRHYPGAQGPMGLLKAVCDAQTRLIVQWLSVGFIHGVMNTDNSSIAGETIDYGPCAFMDTYRADTVLSSIDRGGRYRFNRQPDIAVWNMAQLATALIAQLPDPEAAVEEATEIVNGMGDLFRKEWARAYCAKIGIAEPEEGDVRLAVDLMGLMEEGQADFTNTFRALSDGAARDQFLDPHAFDAWAELWRARLSREADPRAVMRAANPVVIPRNHRVEQMIQAAVAGDYGPFERLNAALARPFDDDPAYEDLRRPPAVDERVQATFCGT
ncbi:protein adenylyltransferase SelO [Chachezhania sediminis]|uniref:protein adenylyltransferase SelO n=1 Tax=Chachezhania sediminis TaxID=2599291 RepID=UPI00131EB28C|nr:YdiU family protein [Chachezhania sediminis]